MHQDGGADGQPWCAHDLESCAQLERDRDGVKPGMGLPERPPELPRPVGLGAQRLGDRYTSDPAEHQEVLRFVRSDQGNFGYGETVLC